MIDQELPSSAIGPDERELDRVRTDRGTGLGAGKSADSRQGNQIQILQLLCRGARSSRRSQAIDIVPDFRDVQRDAVPAQRSGRVSVVPQGQQKIAARRGCAMKPAILGGGGRCCVL